MYLLDTNVISEVRKLRPHGAVTAWLQSCAAEQLFIAAVSLAEIQTGIELTRRQDLDKAREIEAWLDAVTDNANVLPMTGSDFRLWAKLMDRMTSVLSEDAMIAATARNRGLTVATRNVRDFAGFGVELFDPFAVA